MPIVNIFDEETTGRLKPEHKIIELSMRRIDTSTGKEISTDLFRFDPKRSIEKKAFDVHGISLADLKGCPEFKDEAPKIIKLIEESDWICAHNLIGFDLPFLAMEIENAGLELPDKKCFDTMVRGTFATDLGKAPTLQELCWSLDVNYDPSLAHKGDYDTAVLRDAFLNGLKYGYFTLEE